MKATKKPTRKMRGGIKEIFQVHGWFVIPLRQGLETFPGISNLVCIKNGRTLWIEANPFIEFNSQIPAKTKFEEKVMSHGGEYYLARTLRDAVALAKSTKPLEGWNGTRTG